MRYVPPLLVFSDLDGTLLCHDTYDWGPAIPALSKLAEIGAGVILASSKTSSEMRQVRAQMALEQWPAIVENGCGILPSNDHNAPQSNDYGKIRAALDRLAPHIKGKFKGFAEMSVADVVAETGLKQEDAALAKDRAFSEPGKWLGTETEKEAFIAELANEGISAREGGRFLTLSFGNTKADQMGKIVDQLRPPYTVALGDAPNDVEMLQAADFGIIVANPHRSPLPVLPGETNKSIIRTDDPGPVGWNKAVFETLKKLDLT